MNDHTLQRLKLRLKLTSMGDVVLQLIMAQVAHRTDNSTRIREILEDVDYLIEKVKNGSKSENHG